MSEWITWTGGERPVGIGTRVETVLRSGKVDIDFAENWWWGHEDTLADIVAFRAVQDSEKQPAHDPVNKPSHYMLFPEQGIEFIDVRDVLIERLKDFTPKQIDYWSRAFEYLARAGGKNGVEDIKKAKWYLDRLVKTLEEKE